MTSPFLVLLNPLWWFGPIRVWPRRAAYISPLGQRLWGTFCLKQLAVGGCDFLFFFYTYLNLAFYFLLEMFLFFSFCWTKPPHLVYFLLNFIFSEFSCYYEPKMITLGWNITFDESLWNWVHKLSHDQLWWSLYFLFGIIEREEKNIYIFFFSSKHLGYHHRQKGVWAPQREFTSTLHANLPACRKCRVSGLSTREAMNPFYLYVYDVLRRTNHAGEEVPIIIAQLP